LENENSEDLEERRSIMLRRTIAPISEKAWAVIDEQARITLKGNLSGRSVVDFNGPHGWEKASVNLGRVALPARQGKDVQWGIREVLPLVEIRVPFTLSLVEIDSIERGSKDPELDELETAAEKAAMFEDRAVYHGFKEADIEGIIPSSRHAAISLVKKPENFTSTVEKAVVAIKRQGIGGPYDLVLGTGPYEILLAGDQRGYPLRKRINDMTGGEVRWSPVLKGGVVISRRGGDYEFTLGQDFSIGYYSQEKDSVRLYLTESFTFRVVDPRAAVHLKIGA
jgi:uncharacterized linocin/CFP29 family protein